MTIPNYFLNYKGFFLKIPTKCSSKYIKQMYNCEEFGLILQQISILWDIISMWWDGKNLPVFIFSYILVGTSLSQNLIGCPKLSQANYNPIGWYWEILLQNNIFVDTCVKLVGKYPVNYMQFNTNDECGVILAPE